jgi:hypothetical protein
MVSAVLRRGQAAVQRLIWLVWVPLPPLLMAGILFAGANLAVLEDYPSLPGSANLVALLFLAWAGIAYWIVKVLFPGLQSHGLSLAGQLWLLIIPVINYVAVLVHFSRTTRLRPIQAPPGLLAAAMVVPVAGILGVFWLATHEGQAAADRRLEGEFPAVIRNAWTIANACADDKDRGAAACFEDTVRTWWKKDIGLRQIDAQRIEVRFLSGHSQFGGHRYTGFPVSTRSEQGVIAGCEFDRNADARLGGLMERACRQFEGRTARKSTQVSSER